MIKFFKVVFFFILVPCVYTMYKLNIRRCNEYDDYSINYFRYQYDFKYYPQFCDYNHKQFEFNHIEFMKYSLDEFWHACDYEYNSEYSFDKKNELLWEDIWYNYGSCTPFSQYRYFNISMILFYNYKPKFKNCYYDGQYCDYYYDDKLFSVDDRFTNKII